MTSNIVTQTLRVIPDVKRRHGVGGDVKQEVIVIVDTSPSMEGEKARQAQAACEELNDELAKPVNNNGFVVSVIHFNETAIVANPWTLAPKLVGNIRALAIGAYTNMTAALVLARSELESHKRDAGEQYLRPVVLFFTDGCFTDGGSPVEPGGSLRDKADLVTVAFGDDADEVLLRELATSPQHFYRVNSGAELRMFMARAGMTMTMSMAQRRDATHSLTLLKR